MNAVRNLVDAIHRGDSEDTKTFFNQAMMVNIADKLHDAKKDVANRMFKTSTEE